MNKPAVLSVISLTVIKRSLTYIKFVS